MTAPRDVVLILDLGLTNCKASLLDLAAAPVAHRSVRYPTHTPQIGRSEQHPDEWLAALYTAVAELEIAAIQPRVQVVAVAVTAHMHAVVPIDAAGNALATCWTLFDQRAADQAVQINRGLDAYAITGARLEPYTPAAKMLWARQHAPAIFSAAHAFVAPKDFLRIHLGGDLCTDPIDAAGMLLVDLETGAWSENLLAAAGAPRVPEIRPASAPAGTLRADVAARLGLPAGIPIYVGAGDDIEALGAGLREPGDTLEHLGTTGTLITCTASPLRDPAQMLEAYPHAIPGRYLVGGATNAAGLSLDWATRWLANHDASAAGRLPLSLDALRADSPYYLPWIRGERSVIWRPQATGAYLGLRETHTAAALAIGIYEGVAYSVHQILDGILALGRQQQLTIPSVTSGTSLADRPWATLRASIYNRPLQSLQSGDLTALGCAIMTLVGMGVFTDPASAAAQLSRPAEHVEPDPHLQDQLRGRFERWLALSEHARAQEAILSL